MAAVVRGCNWCKLLLSMLILLPLAFPAGQFMNTDTTTWISMVEVTGRDAVLTAEVSAYSLSTVQHREFSELEEAKNLALEGDDRASLEAQQQAMVDYLSQFQSVGEPLEGVDVYFYYYKKYDPSTQAGLAQTGGSGTVLKKEPVPGCYPAPKTDSTGATTCTVPEEVYTYEVVEGSKTFKSQGCVEIIASFGDPERGETGIGNLKPSDDRIVVCGRNATVLGVLAGQMTSALLAQTNSPLCFTSILMAGLLLASMFFSGRSPHSLLDITTPLLPKAKTISYAGLTMGTGFGRMVKEMGNISKHLQSSAGATIPEIMRILRANPKFDLHYRRLVNEIMSSKASNTVKLLALRALLAGRDRAYIRRVISLRNFKWVETDEEAKLAEEYGEILEDLDKDRDANRLLDRNYKGLHFRILYFARHDVQNQMQMKSFAKATGDVPPWITKSVANTLGRVPFLGEKFNITRASLVYGYRRGLMMYSSLARALGRTAYRAVGGQEALKRVQMSVDHRTGKRPTRFQKWIALKPEERKLVTLYDNYEKGSADYKRLMTEAERDVINYLLGCLLNHYFTDQNGRKINLTREQVMRIGIEGPESLLFANFNFRGFRASFRAIEFELRRILSDGNLSNPEKARRIIAMMNREGIAFDGRVSAALRMLERIATERPPGFSENRTDFDSDEDYESVENAHRYLRLRRYLEESFGINRPLDAEALERGDFTFMVGRQEQYDTNRRDFSFGTYFRSTYRTILENPDTLDDFNETGRTVFENTGFYTFLRIANERFGLLDPERAGLGHTFTGVDIRRVMKNMHLWLQKLAVGSGFEGEGLDPTKFKHLEGELFAPGARGPGDPLKMQMHQEELGPRRGMWRVDMHAHWRTLKGPMRGAASAVEQQAYGEVRLAHMVPRAVQELMDESYRTGKPVSLTDAQKSRVNHLIESHLFTRLKDIMEEENPNTYFTSKSEFDRFLGLWDSYRAHLFNLDRRSGRDPQYEHYTGVPDSHIKRYMKRPLGLDEISEGTWLRLREGQFVPFITEHATKLGQADRIINAKYYIKSNGRWSEFSPEALLKGKPLQELLFGEEGSALKPEAIDNLSASDLRLYSTIMKEFESARARATAAGRDYVDLKDLKLTSDDLRKFFSRLSNISDEGSMKNVRGCGAAIMRMFKENRAELDLLGFSDIRGIGVSNSDLMRAVDREDMLDRYLDPRTPHALRARALADLKDWADRGAPEDDRRTKLALLFYSQGREVGNWGDFNNYREAVRLMPASAPLPEEMKGWDSIEAATGLRGFIKKAFYTAQDILEPHTKTMNRGLEQFMLSTFGSEVSAQYAGSITSEYFRQTGGKFAGRLAAGEFGNPTDRNSTAMKEYNRLVDSFMRYHAVWDETITRDPRGNSSAIGNAFIFSSFFHMGPATAYGPAPYRRWSYRGFNNPWYSWQGIKSTLRDLQFSPFVFNYAIGSPFILGYRSYITNRWGFLSKYDRSYRGGAGISGHLEPDEGQQAGAPPPAGAPSGAGGALGPDSTAWRERRLRKQQEEYEISMQQYDQQLRDTATGLQADPNLGFNAERAMDEARRLLSPQMPVMPSPDLQRDTLKPFNMTNARFADARRSMVNWFYSSFDPRAATLGKTAASVFSSPALPLYMVPFQPLQNLFQNKGFFLMNRADEAPYYDISTPQGESRGLIRSAMIKSMGPMVERGYGGAEMQRGVTRSAEDTWMFQSGVNAIWGNANPGVSYVDFTQNLHMDPRAANYLRYESRFRPFFKSDEYVERQANIGLIRRDIDPFAMLMERNTEIQSYRLFRGGQIGDNSLFRFLNPALWMVYKGREYKMKIDRVAYSVDALAKETVSDSGHLRGGRVINATERFGSQVVSGVGNYLHRKLVLGATKSLVHCGSCGGVHAAGSACTACKKKIRCPHCKALCDPFQNHSCSFGVQRNLKMDELYGHDAALERELERRKRANQSRWGRAA